MLKQIDVRLKENDMNILKSLTGQILVSIEHDEFIFSNTSSQIVKFNLEDKAIYLYSFTEPYDYYGSEEDVAVWSIEEKEYPPVAQKEFVKMPLHESVKSISVIQENQQLFENGMQTYDVWVTRGLIIEFGDHQISFEKPVWFSEDIIIRKGYNLIDQFRSVDDIVDNGEWEDGIIMKCIRQIETIS